MFIFSSYCLFLTYFSNGFCPFTLFQTWDSQCCLCFFLSDLFVYYICFRKGILYIMHITLLLAFSILQVSRSKSNTFSDSQVNYDTSILYNPAISATNVQFEPLKTREQKIFLSMNPSTLLFLPLWSKFPKNEFIRSKTDTVCCFPKSHNNSVNGFSVSHP